VHLAKFCGHADSIFVAKMHLPGRHSTCCALYGM
jgi:hypothetical protein